MSNENNMTMENMIDNEVRDLGVVTPIESLKKDMSRNTSLTRTLEKKVSVEKFCKRIDLLAGIRVPEGKTNEELANYIDSHVTNNYVSYAEKCDIARRLVESTYYATIKDINGEEKRKYMQNTPALHMLKILTLINLYTDIEVDFANSVRDFDMLSQRELVGALLARIPNSEEDTFSMLIDMMIDDMYENERSVIMLVENYKNSVSKTVNTIIDAFIKQIENDGLGLQDIIDSIAK